MSENTIGQSAAPIARHDDHLIWLDMEMTGLDPQTDRIIELCVVVTDKQLNVLGTSPAWAIHQSDEILNAMDAWNQKTHGHSGLIERIKQSALSVEDVQKEALAFVQQFVGPKKSPMCGNSICQDRRFMARLMPEFEQYFHYRNLDVSTLKELARRWAPKVYGGFKKQGKHTALDDILESIAELEYYRGQLFREDLG